MYLHEHFWNRNEYVPYFEEQMRGLQNQQKHG